MRTHHRRHAFTLVEVTIATAVAGLLLAAVAVHLLEGSTLGLKTARTLEHVRNARELLAKLSADVRASQVATLYPSFADRSVELADGQTGNYLVLEQIAVDGSVERTIGYYLFDTGTQLRLYRHDSANGDHAADALPVTTTAGSHRIATSAVQLPGATGLFTRLREGGIIVRGEFGRAEGATLGRRDFVQFAASTRS